MKEIFSQMTENSKSLKLGLGVTGVGKRRGIFWSLQPDYQPTAEGHSSPLALPRVLCSEKRGAHTALGGSL